MSIYKQTRLKHELSVREMAEIMGVSQALYRMYESGEPPAATSVGSLAWFKEINN